MIIQLLSNTPAFKKWEESLTDYKKDDYDFYKDVHLRVDQMLCYIDVLWPEFVEIDGMILNKGHLPDDWKSYLDDFKNSELSYTLSGIEYIVNHEHIEHLFINNPDLRIIDEEILVAMAESIAEMWRLNVEKTFPDKKFCVGVDDENLVVYVNLVREDEK